MLATDRQHVLFLGGNGLLGAALSPALAAAGAQVSAPRSNELDIRQLPAIQQALRELGCGLLINAAAVSGVDAAEADPELAFAVNALGAHNAALAAAEAGIPLLQISTDYVFDGGRRKPCCEYHPTGSPLNVYGQAKLDGELLVRQTWRQHFIVRVASLFGAGGRPDFVDRVLQAADPAAPLQIVADRVMNPTWTADLAAQLLALLETPYFGTYHAVSHGSASWYELARLALELRGRDPAGVAPVRAYEMVGAVTRPSFTVLDNHRLRLRGLDRMRPWREALAAHLGR